MRLYRGNSFLQNWSGFDGIICDPPYKRCITDQLLEKEFDAEEFMAKAYNELPKDSFLIVFTNFAMSYDLRHAAKLTKWKYSTLLVWDKSPTRTWIAKSMPLRTTEFILFFTKGKFRFNFQSGQIKAAYKRSSFGGSMKQTTANNRKVSKPHLCEDIFKLTPPRYKRDQKPHPTVKPKDFSNLFAALTMDFETKNALWVANNNEKPTYISKLRVLDPFCGTGQLLTNFTNGIGFDVQVWPLSKNWDSAKHPKSHSGGVAHK
jgi:hypothetical protein